MPLSIGELHITHVGFATNEKFWRIQPLQSSFVHDQMAVGSLGISSAKFFRE
jgi:hypothetical protein